MAVHAPAFPADATWLNTDRPLRLDEELRGRVVVLDFWTYCCVNCMHVLPVLARIEERFAEAPVAVIGVHAAKFTSERDPANIRAALARHHVAHPVVVDSEHEIWEAYAVKAWPTLVLVDAAGRVRETLPGEAQEEDLTRRIQALLDEGREKGLLEEAGPTWSPATVATDASLLRHPGKVLVEGERIWVADTGHHRILQADLRGRVHRIFGGGGKAAAQAGGVGAADGGPEAASFRDPQGMAVLDGGLFVADTGNHLLRRIDLESGETTTVAGTGELWRGERVGVSPPPTQLPLRSPWDLASAEGALLVAMAGSHQIWLHDPVRGIFGPFAGSGSEGHADGPLREAAFAQPSGLSLLGRYLFVADSEVSSVRAVDLQEQRVQSLVGAGLFDFGDVDGVGGEVRLQHPLHVTVGFEGEEPVVYVADTFNNKIKVIVLGTLRCRTVLGSGDPEELHEPGGMDLLPDGRLLIADTNNHRLRIGDPRSGELEDLPLEA